MSKSGSVMQERQLLYGVVILIQMSQRQGYTKNNRKTPISSSQSRNVKQCSRVIIPNCRESTRGIATLEKPSNIAGEVCRNELRELVRRQKQERALKMKEIMDKEKERSRKIAESLAAIEEEARRSAKLSLNVRKRTSSPKRKDLNRALIQSGDITDDEIPMECVQRASELLAGQEKHLTKLPNPVSTILCPSSRSQRSTTSTVTKSQGIKAYSTEKSTSYKSYPEAGLPKPSTSKSQSSLYNGAIASKSLPSESRSTKSTNGFGVQVNLPDPVHFEKRAEVISSWKDAESEQARLKARLCVSRTRRLVHLQADDEDGTDINEDDKIDTSESSSVSSDSSVCDLDPANRTLTPSEHDGKSNGTSLKSLLNNHMEQVNRRKENDPLRFMEVYKAKHQLQTANGDVGIDSDVDKTSDAASTLQASVLEENRTVLHQHIAELEMTRQISMGGGGGLKSLGMTRVDHLKEMKNQALSPIVLPGTGRAPVTLTQTFTQRSYTTTTGAAAAAAHFIPDHSQMTTAADSLLGTAANNHYLQYGINADASSLNPLDMPSTLEVTTAFGEMIDKQPEPFKGILQQRVSDLNARRREAEILINLAKKLDREEQKVYLLENMAVKALTQKQNLRQPLKALAHAVEASSSSSRSTPEVVPEDPLPSAVILPSQQPSPSTIAVQLQPEELRPEIPADSPTSIVFVSSVGEEIQTDSSSSTTEMPSSIASSLVPDRPPLSSSSHMANSSVREQLFVNTDCAPQSQPLPDVQRTQDLFTQISSTPSPRRTPLIAKHATVSPINSPASSLVRLTADSISVSSDLDLAATLDARLKVLNRDLERQQRLLSQIQSQKKQTKNKDSLLRLESTLEHHQRLVEGVIQSLKEDIAACAEEKSALMSRSAASSPSEASVFNKSDSKLTLENISNIGTDNIPTVETDVTPLRNGKSSDVIKQEAVNDSNVKESLFASTLSSSESLNANEISKPDTTYLKSQNFDVTETSTNHNVPGVPSMTTSNLIVSEKLPNESLAPVERPESPHLADHSSAKLYASVEWQSRTLTKSRNFDELPSSQVASKSLSESKVNVDDKLAPEQQEYSTEKPLVKSTPEALEPVDPSSQSNSIVQLPASTELLKSISALGGNNITKLEGSDISNVVIALDDSKKASTPIRSKGDIADPLEALQNELSKSENEKSRALDTVLSELSLATLSEVKSAEKVEGVAAALEKEPSAVPETHSGADTADAYSEDFEDDEFPEEEVLIKTPESAEFTSAVAAPTSPSYSHVDTRAEELLEEWLDIFLEDTLDEFVDDLSLDVIGVTPEDLMPKHSARTSIEPPEEIQNTTGLIVNIPSRTLPLFKKAMDFFYKLRSTVPKGYFEQALKTAEYPPEFSNMYLDEKDMELYRKDPEVYFINRSLFFDLLRTGMLEIFAGEDDDVQYNREIVYTSARLHMWGGRRRPEKQEIWEAYLGPQLVAILGISLDPVAAQTDEVVPLPMPTVYDHSVVRGSISKWTLQSKHYVDQLCEVELRADDPSWFNYRDYISTIINQSTTEVAEQMAVDTIDRLISTMKPSNGLMQHSREQDIAL
nr:Serine rich adhesin for platelets [Hymenolepis microstoma]